MVIKYIKSVVKAIPGVRSVARIFREIRRKRAKKREIELLRVYDLPHCSELSEAMLMQLYGDVGDYGKLINEIEKLRRELSENAKLLYDGTSGAGGIYDDGITVSRATRASKPATQATFLCLLVHHIKPKMILELGTNVGISAAYMALPHKLGTVNSKIITLDSSRYRQKVAKRIHPKLGIDNIEYVDGLFADTLPPTLETYGNWDMVFIDGHHQYQPTLDYFNAIVPHCNKNAVIIFDDIRWSKEMEMAWNELLRDERAGYCIDLGALGLMVLSENEVNTKSDIAVENLF